MVKRGLHFLTAFHLPTVQHKTQFRLARERWLRLGSRGKHVPVKVYSQDTSLSFSSHNLIRDINRKPFHLINPIVTGTGEMLDEHGARVCVISSKGKAPFR